MGQTTIALLILFAAILWLVDRARRYVLDRHRGSACGAACHECPTRATSGASSPPLFEIEVWPVSEKTALVEESKH